VQPLSTVPTFPAGHSAHTSKPGASTAPSEDHKRMLEFVITVPLGPALPEKDTPSIKRTSYPDSVVNWLVPPETMKDLIMSFHPTNLEHMLSPD